MPYGVSTTLRIDGIEKISKRLSILPDRIRNKVVKSAIRDASSAVVKDARRRARKRNRSGILSKSIGIKIKQYAGGALTIGIIGPRKSERDERTGENPAKIAHLVELGTKLHTVTTKGGGLANTKDVAFGFQPKEIFFGKSVRVKADPKPFLKPAWDEKKSEAEFRFAARMAQGVHLEAAKLGVIS